jgi:hypothetical protein
VLNVRKLAAIDLHFLGPKMILAEFGLGVAGLAVVVVYSPCRYAARARCLAHRLGPIHAGAGDQLRSVASVRDQHCAPWNRARGRTKIEAGGRERVGSAY